MLKSESPTTDDEWDDDRDPDMDECEHATVDILTGELSCHCGYNRWLSGEEIRREAQLETEMMEAYYREFEQTEQDAKSAT